MDSDDGHRCSDPGADDGGVCRSSWKGGRSTNDRAADSSRALKWNCLGQTMDKQLFYRWFQSRCSHGLMDMYADDVQFEDVILSCDGKAELTKYFAGYALPEAGEHAFTLNSYVGDASAGAVEWSKT